MQFQPPMQTPATSQPVDLFDPAVRQLISQAAVGNPSGIGAPGLSPFNDFAKRALARAAGLPGSDPETLRKISEAVAHPAIVFPGRQAGTTGGTLVERLLARRIGPIVQSAVDGVSG